MPGAPVSELVWLDIAGLVVALEIPDGRKRAEVRVRYGAFTVTGGDPRVIVRIELRPGLRVIPLRIGTWLIDLVNDGGRLSYRSHFDAGWLDIENGRGFLEIAPEADIENFLRVLYAHLCVRDQGLLLHAAGIVRDGAGFVFFGASGSGKSTTARLSAGKTVLSDDLVIVKRHAEGVRVYGVPFHGDFPEGPRANQSAPLAGLFSLVKATGHRVATVPVAEGLARLVACAPFVMTDAANAGHVMGLARQIGERVPVRALHFRLDPGFWSELDGY